MKTPTRIVRNLAAATLLSACAIPFNALAARTVATLFAVPASTNVTVGVATSVTANVIITNGTGGSTRYVGLCTFSVSVSGPDGLVTASISPTTIAFPNPGATLGTNATLTVTAQNGFSAGTYTVFIVADTNPPNATLVTPKTNTFVFNPPAVVNYGSRMYWTSPGINTNWSTGANWTPNGPPVSTNDVFFVDASATNAAGVVNNVVDASTTVGSLTYGQTNGFHTTQINPGVAVTVGGTNGLSAGTGSDANIITVNTVTGAGGALLVTNTGALFVVSQSHAADNPIANAQLDLSGLDSFQAQVARVVVGADLAIKGAAGTLKLARTNTIALTTGSAAPQLDVGDATLAQGIAGTNSVLLLGQTNGFLVDSIAVGRGKNMGTGGTRGSSMRFNNAFSSPTATFRGTAGGSSRVATWSIGDGSIAKGTASATNDFSLGSLDALVDTMYVGRGASVSGGSDGAGTLSIGAGTMDVNTLNVGRSEVGAGHGTINLTGGLLVVNTALVMANNNSSVPADGTLNVLGGTLTANAGVTFGGGTARINVYGAALNATNSTASIGTATAPVAFLAISNSVLTLPVRNATPACFVNTDLGTFGTTNIINVSSLPVFHVLPAQLPVIQIDLAAFVEGTFNIGLGTLPPGGFAGYISNNLANYTVDLVVTSGPTTPILQWDGASSGDWDLATQNWKTNGVLTTYSQGYPLVQFDDTLTGTNTVNLTTTLTPGTLTVTNSATNYTFTGSGKISGATGLAKQGSGLLTLAETGGDDFSGGIMVSGGTLALLGNNNISGGTTIGSGAFLVVGNDGVTGNLPAGAVANGGELGLQRSDDITVTNSVTGGLLTQYGNGVLTLSGTNSAGITVEHGTVRAGSVGSLGTAELTVNAGATLDVNAMPFNNGQEIFVSGAGVGGGGAIVNSGTNQTKVLRLVILNAATTFGGSGDWDIRSSQSGSTVNGDGQLYSAFKLTKAGTNTITLFGVQVTAMGDLDVLAGTLSVERNTTGLGDPTKTIAVFTNATLQFQSASNFWNKVVLLKDGATFKNTAIDNTFQGPVTLESGVGTITANNAQFTLTNVISGAGGLTKNGTNTLVLSSSNIYSGPTLISAGTLALTGAGALAASPVITVASGATLDASGRSDGTLTLGSGQTLKGNGLVIAAVVATNGSTVAPGSSVGILTINHTLSLLAGSTTVMELDKGNQTNDLIRGLSSISYGGTLSVTNLSGTLAAGDSFLLFQSGGYANSFAATNLPALAPGLGWTNTLATDGRIAVINVVNPAPTNIVATLTSPNTLDLAWPADHTGWTLQSQTNSEDIGLSTNWAPVGGSASTNHVEVTIDPANGTVFYRLVYP